MPGVEIERLAACPNCGSRAARFWLRARDRLLKVSDQVFEYSQCAGCGVAFQSVRPTAAAAGRFYSEGYAPHEGGVARARRNLPSSIDRLALRLANRIIGADRFKIELNAFYSKQLEEKPRFLDFGCGSGKFLHRARKFGCEAIGMDFSENALAAARGRGHQVLGMTEADWGRIPDRSVGLVRMNHVVEHLYDPLDTLRRLRSKMTDGAAIHVATPNLAGAAAERYGQHWFSLDCPRHVILFTPHSLASLLRAAGFEDVRMVHEPLTKDMARSWVYREQERGRFDGCPVGDLAYDGWLNLRFALACRATMRHGRGDRIHAFAIRR